MPKSSNDRSAFVMLVAAVLCPSGALVAQSDASKLEHCEKPLGTLAVVEPQTEVLSALQKFKLGSPTSLIRMMVQQSNCFTVVERGVGMQNIMQERELAKSGELQQGSNLGGGQLKAADFVLTPNVIFSEGNAGGIGGAVGSAFGRRNSVIGAVAGGLKFKEAQTSMLVSDTRSGVQVAAAEGKARKKDFAIGVLGSAGGPVGGVGGYTNTNEGKVVAASFLDNYNNIVTGVRNDPNLRPSASGGSEAASARNTKAGAVFAEGDVLAPKIDNVRVVATPSATGRPVGTVGKVDELVFMGEEKDGYLRVQGGSLDGWVRRTLVVKR